jgi:hypothetical protein
MLNRRPSYIKLPRLRSLGNRASVVSYCANLVCREFGFGVILPSRASLSSLCYHVSHVIGVCSQPKMMRVAAARVVARVANKKAVWYGTVNHSPCYTRRAIRPSCLPHKESSSAPRINVAGPRPAILFRFAIYFSPKVAPLAVGVFDLFAKFRDCVRSFFHSACMTEVRARLAGLTAPALVYYEGWSMKKQLMIGGC